MDCSTKKKYLSDPYNPQDLEDSTDGERVVVVSGGVSSGYVVSDTKSTVSSTVSTTHVTTQDEEDSWFRPSVSVLVALIVAVLLARILF